jgi:tetratricopeptide (TPR) repeat protein
MKRRRVEAGLAPRLLLLFVCVLVLGLSPRPHAFDQALRQANRSLADDLPQRASQAVAEAARLAPWRADLWELAGVYAFQAEDPEAAIEYLEAAQHRIAPSLLSLQSLTILGQAYWQAGDAASAFRVWGQAIDAYGPSVQVLEQLVAAHLEQGDYPDAIAHLKTLAELQPQDAELHYKLGLLLAALDPPAAQSYLDRAAQLDARRQSAAADIRRAVLSARFAEDPAYTLLTSGRALAAIGEWSAAAQAFHRAATLRPDYAEAWAYLGESLQHGAEGTLILVPVNRGDGLAELRKALELDPNSLAAHTFLALYYARRGSFDLAQEALQKAVALEPGNLALKVQLAGLLAASGDLYQAKETYLQVIQQAPQDPSFARHFIQFMLDYDFEVAQTALPLARRLVAQQPDQPANLDLMAQVLIHQGDLASAIRFLGRALALDPAFTAAWLHLGQARLLQGDRVEALSALGQVMTLSPNSPEAARAQRLIDSYLR